MEGVGKIVIVSIPATTLTSAAEQIFASVAEVYNAASATSDLSAISHGLKRQFTLHATDKRCSGQNPYYELSFLAFCKRFFGYITAS
jgi:hypothetical protein